jgi:hypothetical protein
MYVCVYVCVCRVRSGGWRVSEALTYNGRWRRRLIQGEVPEEDYKDRSDDYRLSGRTWTA